jgi:hypothetical protein
VFLSFAIPWSWLFDAVAPRVGGWLRETAPPAVGSVPGAGGDLRPIHLMLIVVVCVHAMLRLPAGFGRFESYSGTYSSTAEFDRIDPLLPIDRAWVGYGSPTAVEVDAGVAADAIRRLAQGQSLTSGDASKLESLDHVETLARDSPRRLTLTRQRTSFDWTNGRFNPPGPAVVVGTLDLGSMTLVSEPPNSLPSPRPQSE